MSAIEIRPATQADLGLLIATFGDENFFTDRLVRQNYKRGVLLTAWIQHDLIGSAYIRMEPADEQTIRDWLPGVPLLNRIEIRPDYRDRGHGTALIRHAEQRLVKLGYSQVALAVTTNNGDASRLYKRMHYESWGHPPVQCRYEVIRPDGSREQGTEECYVMVKQLRGSSA